MGTDKDTDTDIEFDTNTGIGTDMDMDADIDTGHGHTCCSALHNELMQRLLAFKVKFHGYHLTTLP
jgi:hypothetical protein